MALKFQKMSFYMYFVIKFVTFGVERLLGAKEVTMEQVKAAE